MRSSRWHALGNSYLLLEDAELTPERVRELVGGADGILAVEVTGAQSAALWEADEANHAEDIVQLTFLVAYRDLVRTEPPFAVRPWLYAIARHRCRSVLRARRTRPPGEMAEPAVGDVAG